MIRALTVFGDEAFIAALLDEVTGFRRIGSVTGKWVGRFFGTSGRAITYEVTINPDGTYYAH